ncbi:hypothetical protein L842_0722 [Mycobacterium intracellulare MIN_052511_1280]|nr:hypothetical protein L842_0722 [Mycobacterium intracellulare MIN_052511_1280]
MAAAPWAACSGTVVANSTVAEPVSMFADSAAAGMTCRMSSVRITHTPCRVDLPHF